MRTERKKAVVAAFCLLAAIFLSSCGYKDLPVPPEQVVPKTVADLRFVDEDGQGRLEWTYPVESVTGQNLPEIDSFELFQTSVPAKDYCPACPIPFRQPQVLPAGESSIQGKKRTASTPVPHLIPGNKYFFKVRSRTSWWAASGDSNVVTFVWKAAASVPRNLRVNAGRKSIALAWLPVQVTADGSPLTAPARYQVQRSDDDKTFARIAVVDAPGYTDNAVRQDQKYFYRVQALIRADNGEESAGEVSDTVSAALAEAPPLLPPEGVGIAATAAGVRVYWDAVENTAGYRIYRRAAAESNYQPLGEADALVNIFIDKSAKEGVRYYYVITTLGADDEESAQSRPVSSRW